MLCWEWDTDSRDLDLDLDYEDLTTTLPNTVSHKQLHTLSASVDNKDQSHKAKAKAKYMIFKAKSKTMYFISVLKPKFHLARHVSTRHDTIRSTCRAHAFSLCRACRTARLDTIDTTTSTGATRNLVMITVIHYLFNVSYSLIYWSTIYLIYFIWRNKYRVCKSTNNWTCTGEHYSLFAVRHVGTSTARRARHVERIESCLDVTWRANWNLGYKHSPRPSRNPSTNITAVSLHAHCNNR